jgi:hypothetical protein
LIEIILEVANKEYCAILTIERNIKGYFLTIEDLEREMTEEYRQNTQNQQCTFSNEGEMALFQRQGTCYNCKKIFQLAN